MHVTGKTLVIIGGVIGATSTVAGTVYTAQNPDLVKDYIKGNPTYSNQQMVDVKKDYEQKIETLENENSQEVSRLNALIASSNTKISELQSDNEVKIEQINLLQAEFTATNNRIAELEQSDEDKSAEIAELQADNTAKTQEIATLTTSVNENTAKITELENKVATYEDVLSNYVVVTYVVDEEENIVVQDKNSGIDFDDPKKEGYIFNGWSLSENGSVIDKSTTFSEDVVLYAVFEENKTVSFNYRTTTSVANVSDSYENADNYSNGFAPDQSSHYEFYGWATTPTSTTIVSSFVGGSTYYAVYMTSGGVEYVTYSEYSTGVVAKAYYLTSMVGMFGSECVGYMPLTLDNYTFSLTVDSVSYNFKGWATSSDSTTITTSYTSTDIIYAVYENALTEELVSYTAMKQIIDDSNSSGDDFGDLDDIF